MKPHEGAQENRHIRPDHVLLGKLGASEDLKPDRELSISSPYGPLLGTAPNIASLVVTEAVFANFARELPLNTGLINRRQRGMSLFRSIHRHATQKHGAHIHSSVCSCHLRGGRATTFSRYNPQTSYYLEPFSLVAAYEADEIDRLPIGPGTSIKPLHESVNYEILPLYIAALTS